MTTQLLFTLIVLAIAVQRIAEVRLSKRHEAKLRAEGGREVSHAHFRWMQVLHTSWFFAMLAEVWLFDRPFSPWLFSVALVVTLVGQTLRYAAIRTLGDRWTVTIWVLPAAPPVTGGIYRYVRHPNYLGVILELAAVPLLHTAWTTALVWSLLNAWMLRVRIRAEEAALEEANRYTESFGETRRFLPS
ncbi:MAG: isoprenylcysteine carboxylmethyltransferase family protein [Bacteroidota bacterium]